MESSKPQPVCFQPPITSQVLGRPNKNLLMHSKSSSFSKSVVQELTFKNLQPKVKRSLGDLNSFQTEIPYLFGRKPDMVNDEWANHRENNNSVHELFVIEDIIVTLTTSGVCTAFNKGKVLIRLIPL